MININRRAMVMTAVLMTGVFAAFAARAQSWPSGPIRIVVPFAAGGTVDAIPRMLQPGLQERLGVPVIIENKTGASGTIGTAVVAKAAPNGYTWLSIADTLGISPALFQNLPFDTEKDLEPVLLIGTSPYVLAINPTRPFKTLADVIAAAKQNPGSVSYATYGTGSGPHLAMLLLAKSAGVTLVHAPYRGGAPAVADAVAGHVDLVIGTPALLLPFLKSGKLRGVVQFGPNRLPVLAELPTVGEYGFTCNNCVVWWSVFAPAGTPKPIIERFRAELVTGLKDERVAKQLTENMQIKLTLDGPEDLRKFLAEQMRVWGAVVREHQIKME